MTKLIVSLLIVVHSATAYAGDITTQASQSSRAVAIRAGDNIKAAVIKSRDGFLTTVRTVRSNPRIKSFENFFREKTALFFKVDYGITGVQRDQNSILISGRSPGPRSVIVIYVVKSETDFQSYDEEPSAIVLPGQSPNFSARVYFRSGPGNYHIRIFSSPNHQKEKLSRFMLPIAQIVTTTTATKVPELIPSYAAQSNSGEIRALARQLTSRAVTKYEAAFEIHSWVSANIAFDDALIETMGKTGRPFERPISALASLRLKKGVCSDYAVLAVALLRSVQIPARFITGLGLNSRNRSVTGDWATSENHAWVQAFIDGRWIDMDPTFESGAGGYEFFDAPAETFALSHKRARVQSAL